MSPRFDFYCEHGPHGFTIGERTALGVDATAETFEAAMDAFEDVLEGHSYLASLWSGDESVGWARRVTAAMRRAGFQAGPADSHMVVDLGPDDLAPA